MNKKQADSLRTPSSFNLAFATAALANENVAHVLR